jgi:cytochrome c oxidase subunit 2
MMNSIIVLGVILVLAILYLIFRVGSLVTVAKGEQDSRVEKGNGVHATLFLLFIIVSLTGFFWYSYTYFEDYNLPLASEHGAETDKLFWITMGITVVAFAIISIVMFVFIYKYRYDSTRKAAFFPDNHYLELTWTIIPGIVLAVLVFTGLRAWNDITAPASKNAEVIELIGQQFAWTARYPGKDKELGKVNFKMIDATNEFGLDLTDGKTHDDFKSLELHLPVNKEIF